MVWHGLRNIVQQDILDESQGLSLPRIRRGAALCLHPPPSSPDEPGLIAGSWVGTTLGLPGACPIAGKIDCPDADNRVIFRLSFPPVLLA